MNNAVQFLDGGLSTALERLGFRTDHELWTAAALVHAPELVVAAHGAFLEAGAEVILTASYQAGITNVGRVVGDEARARQMLVSSVALARQAIELAHRTDARVASSLGAYGALLADRSEYHGRYPVPWSEVAKQQRVRAETLLDTGVDLMVCETLPTVSEAAVTLDVLDELIPRYPAVEVWVTFTAVGDGWTAGGEALGEVSTLLVDRPWVTAVGVNCTAPHHVGAALAALGATPVALIAKPNHLPEVQELRRWIDAGVRHLGGCCGVGPQELAEAIASLR
jgi:S-methylmethionine-dependent homocysteine/selenocysteine methylase